MKSALKYSGLWEIVDQGLAKFPEDLPEDAEEAAVLTYQTDLKAWNEVNNQAAELIYSMCEEKPAEAIEDINTAISRWLKLQDDYTETGFIPRFTKFQELRITTLASSNNSIKTYIANIYTKSRDLKRIGAPVEDWILVALLLNNLDSKYKDFVHRLLVQLDDTPDFDKIVSLLHEEDRLLKRDIKEQAMAAAMKKFNKEQEDEKNPRSHSNDSGWGGRKSTRGRGNNNTSGTRTSTNPHSSNYKGDGAPPECQNAKCVYPNGNKKKHWPYDCFIAHPDRIPDRYKKPKANVTTGNDRPDDFVDHSSTHISAMAHMRYNRHASEEDSMADEEFWGLPATYYAPNLGGTAVEDALAGDSTQYSPDLREEKNLQEEKFENGWV